MSFLFGRKKRAKAAAISSTDLSLPATVSDHAHNSNGHVKPQTPLTGLKKSTSLMDVLRQKIISKRLHQPPAQPTKKQATETKVTSVKQIDVDKEYEAIKAKYYAATSPNNAAQQQSNLRISCLLNGYSSSAKSYPKSNTLLSIDELSSKKSKVTVPPSTPMNNTSKTLDSSAGVGFLRRLDAECEALSAKCRAYELVLSEKVDTDEEDLCGHIQAAIGQTRLLMAKRIEQFRQLCYDNLCAPSPDKPETTANDLAGYWDMLQTQIDGCNRAFDTIRKMMSGEEEEEDGVQENAQYEAVAAERNSGTTSPARPSIKQNVSGSSKETANSEERKVPSKSIALRKMIREQKRLKNAENRQQKEADL